MDVAMVMKSNSAGTQNATTDAITAIATERHANMSYDKADKQSASPPISKSTGTSLTMVDFVQE